LQVRRASWWRACAESALHRQLNVQRISVSQLNQLNAVWRIMTTGNLHHGWFYLLIVASATVTDHKIHSLQALSIDHYHDDNATLT